MNLNIFKRWFIAGALALVSIMAGASAQETRSQLNQYNNTMVIANGRGAITGPIANSMYGQLITSSGMLNDTNVWTGANSFTGPFSVPSFSNVAFYAQYYGPCATAGGTFAGQDAGACVMAAYNAAVIQGGGTIIVPPGALSQSTPINFSAPFISLQCGGTGNTRNNASTFVAATTFTATSALTGLTQFTMSPAPGAGAYLYGMGLSGCLFNANGVAATGVQISDVAYGFNLQIACEEATTTCANLHVYDLFSGQGGGPGPGNQQDRVSVYFKQVNNNGTGFLIDRANFNSPDILYNNSYSRILSVNGNYNNGDGIVVSGADNLFIGDVELFNTGGGGGKACVVANTGYVTPSGTSTIGIGGSVVFEHLGVPCLVTGYQNGFTPVANVGNTCVGCGPTTVTLSTNAQESNGSKTLPFSSTAGLVTDMAGSCTTSAAGTMPGMLPGDQIFSINPGVSVTLVQPIVATMASGSVCTFGSTIRGSAAPGAYTIAYNGSTWALTAPAGGHSQSGVTMSSGVAVFTDFIWVFTGSANSGDSWTFNANTPPQAIILDGVDSAINNIQYGVFQYGASGWARFTGTFNPISFGSAGIGTVGISLNGGGATGVGCVSLMIFSGCTGQYATSMGLSNGVSGAEGVGLGGTNNTESGTFGMTGGSFANDNGLYNASFRGGGNCNGQGSCQRFSTIVSNTGAGSSTVTLTANLANANSASTLNCINLTRDNSSAAFTVSILIQQEGAANGESWNGWGMLLARGTGVGSTTLFKQSTPTPLNSGVGGSVSAAQDATNGCLTLQVTLPAGGTWTATAVVDGSMAY